jgi:hypothetical protein
LRRSGIDGWPGSGDRPHDGDRHETPTLAGADGSARRAVCALSGSAATPLCPAQILEWVPEGAPPAPCTWHRQTRRGVVVEWPPEYRAWAAGEHLLDSVVVSAAGARAVAATKNRERLATPVPALANAADRPLRVINPPDGAVYLIDPTLRREFQTIPLRGAADGGGPIEWRVDDTVVGTATNDAAIDWPLAPGRHVISARDARGRRAATAIVVR